MHLLGVLAFAVVVTMVGASGLASGAGILSDVASTSASSSATSSFQRSVSLDQGTVFAAIALGCCRDRNAMSTAITPLSGDLSGTSLRGEFIADASIATGSLFRVVGRDSAVAAGRVTQSDLADATIASSAVARTNLLRGSVMDSELSRSQIDGTHIAGSALHKVTAVNANISDSDIKRSQIGGSMVTNSHIWGSDIMGSTVTGGSIERSRIDQATLATIDPAMTALCRVEVQGMHERITTRC